MHAFFIFFVWPHQKGSVTKKGVGQGTETKNLCSNTTPQGTRGILVHGGDQLGMVVVGDDGRRVMHVKEGR
jgi:hypothetical protein